MSDEPWDADRIAAECKATADAKVHKTRRRRKHRDAAPPLEETATPSAADPPLRDPKTGAFLPGHAKIPGTGGSHDEYDPAFAARVKRWAEMGATVSEICDWLDCNVKTFYRWCANHDDLREAYRIGKAPNDDRVTRSLFERATGYTYTEEVAIKVKIDQHVEKVEKVTLEKHMPADPASMAFYLVNRRPDLWQHKKTIEHQQGEALPTVDEARRKIEEWLREEQGPVIDVTPKEVSREALPAPDFDPDF